MFDLSTEFLQYLEMFYNYFHSVSVTLDFEKLMNCNQKFPDKYAKNL